jgi:hypothetical protein
MEWRADEGLAKAWQNIGGAGLGMMHFHCLTICCFLSMGYTSRSFCGGFKSHNFADWPGKEK